MENKLKVQIWSDIMCPFCYIGKRRIEEALQNFEHKEAVEIEWKSFHFDKAVMANSLNAHRLLHLAKKYNLANDLEELLFKSYLTDGKNINDLNTLKELGLEVGLNAEAIDEVLNSNTYANEVRQDIKEAQSIGLQGVPFFVFDTKYAISGAQPAAAFLQALEKVWEEGKFKPKVTLRNTTAENSCDINGCG